MIKVVVRNKYVMLENCNVEIEVLETTVCGPV